MALIHCSPLPMMTIAKHLPQTDDAKYHDLMLLSESVSVSQLNIFILSKVRRGGKGSKLGSKNARSKLKQSSGAAPKNFTLGNYKVKPGACYTIFYGNN